MKLTKEDIWTCEYAWVYGDKGRKGICNFIEIDKVREFVKELNEEVSKYNWPCNDRYMKKINDLCGEVLE